VISYSRHDQPQIRAIVSLLKTALRDIEKAVFWDGDFEPGDAWFEQIKEHIDAAQQLFVFWCWHSANSEQVRRELTYALSRQKRVVPVLLDSTALSLELASIHGIDLRAAVVHPPSVLHQPENRVHSRRAMPTRSIRLWWVGGAVVAGSFLATFAVSAHLVTWSIAAAIGSLLWVSYVIVRLALTATGPERVEEAKTVDSKWGIGLGHERPRELILRADTVIQEFSYFLNAN
jgi:hypothetical protein